MKNVFRALTVTEAGVVRNLLVENGIEARLIEGYASYGSFGGHEVWIPNDDDAERAIALVRELLEPQQDSTTKSWICRGCHETSPASFDSCWHCGTARLEKE